MELGLYGLGRMGGNMVIRLRQGGHRVVAANRSPGPVDEAAKQGAIPAYSPEEMVSKLRAGFASTTDETLKKQGAGFKVYKATEPFGSNTLYVVQLDPVVPNAEYDLFAMLQKTLTPDQLRDPATQDMWKKFAGAFAAGLSKLSLTTVSGQ